MRASEIAARLNAKAGSGYWLALCVAHEDSRPSLSIQEKDGRAMFKCHSGCSWESIRDALKARGIEVGGDRDPGWETAYAIKDGSGTTIAEHVRIDRDGGKVVFWRPKLSDIGRRVVDMPLYGTELLSSREGAAVLCEGEKSAASAQAQKLLALGTVTGAAACPSDDVLRCLTGRKVYLWPDNDDEGRKHMIRIAGALSRLGIEWATVHWPEAPPKGDAADFFGGGRTVADFKALLAAAPPKVEAPSAPRRRHLWEGVRGALSEMDRFSAGDFSGRVPLGIPALDKRLRGGLRGGQLTLLGAPTGAGKTSLVQQFAIHAVRTTGRPAFFASPEMSIEALAEREIISAAGVELWDIAPWKHSEGRTKAQAAMAYAASKLLAEKIAVIVMEELDPTMADIAAAVMEEHARTPLSMVVIDYAQYVARDTADSKAPRYLQVGEVGRGSVALARRLDIPVLVTAQVNVTREKGGKPTYTWRESAELEKHAHNALILDIDWNIPDSGPRTVEGARIIGTKVRDAGGFVQEIHYEPHLYRASDPRQVLSDSQAPEWRPGERA